MLSIIDVNYIYYIIIIIYFLFFYFIRPFLFFVLSELYALCLFLVFSHLATAAMQMLCPDSTCCCYCCCGEQLLSRKQTPYDNTASKSALTLSLYVTGRQLRS